MVAPAAPSVPCRTSRSRSPAAPLRSDTDVVLGSGIVAPSGSSRPAGLVAGGIKRTIAGIRRMQPGGHPGRQRRCRLQAAGKQARSGEPARTGARTPPGVEQMPCRPGRRDAPALRARAVHSGRRDALEMVDDPHIGGLSAVYTIDHATVKGPVADYLVAGQRARSPASTSTTWRWPRAPGGRSTCCTPSCWFPPSSTCGSGWGI